MKVGESSKETAGRTRTDTYARDRGRRDFRAGSFTAEDKPERICSGQSLTGEFEIGEG